MEASEFKKLVSRDFEAIDPELEFDKLMEAVPKVVEPYAGRTSTA